MCRDGDPLSFLILFRGEEPMHNTETRITGRRRGLPVADADYRSPTRITGRRRGLPVADADYRSPTRTGGVCWCIGKMSINLLKCKKKDRLDLTTRFCCVLIISRVVQWNWICSTDYSFGEIKNQNQKFSDAQKGKGFCDFWFGFDFGVLHCQQI